MKRVVLSVVLITASACTRSDSTGAGGTATPTAKVLSPDSANQKWARFSPDGKHVFWWEPSGNGSQLWMANADLSNPTKVPVTTLTAPPPLLWSPDHSKIAVASSDAGLLQVATIPAEGGPPTQVTNVSGAAVPNGWNPDNDRISYVASAAGGTFQSFFTSVSKPGGNALVPGLSGVFGGAWSPDGSHIAILRTEAGKTTLWVADGAGKNLRQLTTDGYESFGNNEGIFSPDGKWIAYESRRTGFSDVWIAPVDSGAPRQMTHDVRNDWSPLWSPDGQWVAFLSDRGKQQDIWVIPAAGGEERRVTDDADYEDLMQWTSPTTLAFLTGQGASGIWSRSLGDSAEKRLTPDSLRCYSPLLSPDGKQVLFQIDHGGGITDLAVMPIGGGAMRVLVTGGNNSTYRWSPDGSSIGYQSDKGGTLDIWVVDVAGGAPRQLDNWPGQESQPAWSGDGSSIFFLSDRESKVQDVWKVAAKGGEPERVTHVGTVIAMANRPPRSELYVGIINNAGSYEVEIIGADGTLTPAWKAANSFPADVTPEGDSLVVAAGKTTGGFSFRLVPAKGGGEGRVLPGPYSNMSNDGSLLFYMLPTGSHFDIGVLNRKDGSTRQLTNTASWDENSVSATPDNKTVVFQRSRSIRRIATVDLSKVLKN